MTRKVAQTNVFEKAIHLLSSLAFPLSWILLISSLIIPPLLISKGLVQRHNIKVDENALADSSRQPKIEVRPSFILAKPPMIFPLYPRCNHQCLAHDLSTLVPYPRSSEKKSTHRIPRCSSPRHFRTPRTSRAPTAPSPIYSTPPWPTMAWIPTSSPGERRRVSVGRSTPSTGRRGAMPAWQPSS